MKKNNRGGRREGAGRKKGIGLVYDIQKQCKIMIEELMMNDKFKEKAEQQLIEKYNDHKLKELEECFYVLESNGKYKFGFSSDIRKRIKVYSTHNKSISIVSVSKGLTLDGLSPFELEGEMIEKYEGNRIDSSEWFEFSHEELIKVLNFINESYYGQKSK